MRMYVVEPDQPVPFHVLLPSPWLHFPLRVISICLVPAFVRVFCVLVSRAIPMPSTVAVALAATAACAGAIAMFCALAWSAVMYWNDNDVFPYTAALFLVVAAAAEVGFRPSRITCHALRQLFLLECNFRALVSLL